MFSSERNKRHRLRTFVNFMIFPLQRKFCLVSILLCLKFIPMASSNTPDAVTVMNDNSTVQDSLTNITLKNETTDSMRPEGAWCQCSIEHDDNENELECHCEGQKLLKVPQNLRPITRLSIANAKLKVLREAGLRKYSSSLKDLWVRLKCFELLIRFIVQVHVATQELSPSQIFNKLSWFLQYRALSFPKCVTSANNVRRLIYDPMTFVLINDMFPNLSYISHAPKLQYIAAEVFRYISHSFKTLWV